jgi:phage terminase large subunit GpA-like protein
VFWLTYQREDGATLEILNTGIDTGGIEGATENAYAFWHTARASGVHASRIMLLKGGNRPDAPILARPSWIEHKGGRQKAVPLYVVNVHRLKGILEARLRRAEPGPGYVHLADDFAAEHMAELLAEERDDKGLWQKTGPNETLDLTVYAIAGLQRHAGKRTDMAWLPAQFRARPDTTGEAAPARLPAATRERHSPVADKQPETPAPVSAAPAPVRRRRRGLRGGVKG